MEEIERLRAAMAAAHDHLHHGRIDEAHEALHCGAECHDEPSHLPGQNITQNAAAKLHEFSGKFNQLCESAGVAACWVSLVPSATKAGHVSIQIGGHVDTINAVRELMGAGPTIAVGDHARPRIDDMARSLIQQVRNTLPRPDLSMPPMKPFTHQAPHIGRNELCPCGSGKKFKSCHMSRTSP